MRKPHPAGAALAAQPQIDVHTTKGGLVVVDFRRKVRNIIMTREQAIHLAAAIARHAGIEPGKKG